MEQVINETGHNTAEISTVSGALQNGAQRQVVEIELGAVGVSKTNGIFRRKHELTKEALQELSTSITQYGVIQPILVRLDKYLVNSYELICGERRFRASEFAGKTHIPAYVVDVSDEVALILQITENIQRENVHPLNEAKGYKLMMEADVSITTGELALRFGKSETYILQRLKLNDLVKEAKKDFYEGRMHLGHAVVLCRLLPHDQKEMLSSYRDRDGYGTVGDLQAHVERNLMCNLQSAPFDKTDADLHKKAGACINCVKRSGASPLLFPDLKEKDNCLDRGCFFMKCDLFLVLRVRKAIETEPDMAFLSEGYGEPNEKISQMLEEHKLKPLRQYDDFNTYDTGGAKLKGLWINGSKAGQVATVCIKKSPKQAPQGPEGLPVQIEKIKHRMERGRELDREKVYAKILDALKDHPSQKRNFGEKMMPDEEVMLWFIIFDKAGYHIKDELLKVLGVSKEDPEKLYKAIKTLKPEERAFMLRRVILDQYGGNYPDSAYGFIIQRIAAGYGDIDIAGFEKEQDAIAVKRETRAGERITELKRAGKMLGEQARRKTKKAKTRKGA